MKTSKKNLVVGAATLICFYNELLTVIIVNCVQRRARKTLWWCRHKSQGEIKMCLFWLGVLLRRSMALRREKAAIFYTKLAEKNALKCRPSASIHTNRICSGRFCMSQFMFKAKLQCWSRKWREVKQWKYLNLNPVFEPSNPKPTNSISFDIITIFTKP